MLSIAPAWQRQGLGRRLIDAVEARARERGCRVMDIHIVNLREELPPYYRRFGYAETGSAAVFGSRPRQPALFFYRDVQAAVTHRRS